MTPFTSITFLAKRRNPETSYANQHSNHWSEDKTRETVGVYLA